MWFPSCLNLSGGLIIRINWKLLCGFAGLLSFTPHFSPRHVLICCCGPQWLIVFYQPGGQGQAKIAWRDHQTIFAVSWRCKPTEIIQLPNPVLTFLIFILFKIARITWSSFPIILLSHWFQFFLTCDGNLMFGLHHLIYVTNQSLNL